MAYAGMYKPYRFRFVDCVLCATLTPLLVTMGCGGKGSGPDPTTAPAVKAFSANPTAIEVGSPFNVSWTSANADACALTSSPPNGSGNLAVVYAASSPSPLPAITPTLPNTYTYSLTCSKGSASSAPFMPQTVNVVPVLSYSLSVSTASILTGQSVTLSWSSNGSGCAASGAWSGTKTASGAETVTPGAAGSSVFTLTCSSAAKAISKSVTVAVIDPPTVSLTTTGPVTIGNTSTLTWKSNSVNNCIAGGSLNGWSGAQATNGVLTLLPSSAKDYAVTLTCVVNGTSNMITASALVAVNATCAEIFSPAYYLGSHPDQWEHQVADFPLPAGQVRNVILNPDSGMTSITVAGTPFWNANKPVYDRVVAKGAMVPGYFSVGSMPLTPTTRVYLTSASTLTDVQNMLIYAKSQVDSYGINWGVSYFFLDEVHSQYFIPGIDLVQTLYQPIVDYITAKSANAQITLNPGSTVEEAFINITIPATATLRIVTFENTFDIYLNSFQAPTWASKHSSDRFVNIIHTGGTNWKQTFDLAQQRNIGHLYFTERNLLPNPFDQLPASWDAMAAYSRNGCH